MECKKFRLNCEGQVCTVFGAYIEYYTELLHLNLLNLIKPIILIFISTIFYIMKEKNTFFYQRILLVFIFMVCACQKKVSPNISNSPTIPIEDPIIIEVNWTEEVYADLIREYGILEGPKIVLKTDKYDSWRSDMRDLGQKIWNGINDDNFNFESHQTVIDSLRKLGIGSRASLKISRFWYNHRTHKIRT